MIQQLSVVHPTERLEQAASASEAWGSTGSSAGRSPGAAVQFSVWTALAAAFTAIIINYSMVWGKLCVYPFYDDVAYFEQSLTLLHHYYADGLMGMIRGYISSPPHSLFSGLLALTAYAICGLHDWSPYAANGLIVLSIILFVSRFCRNMPFIQQLLVVLFVLSIPVMGHAVDAFRPDIASGACAAAGAALLARGPLSRSGRGGRIFAGCLVGAALLFKPPTLPLSIALLLVGLAAGVAQDILLLHLPPRRAFSPAALAECLLPALLIPLPHYLLTWKYYYRYVQSELVGDTRDVWSRHGTWGWHIRYFLDGEGGSLMLGRHLYLLAGVCLIGFLFAAWRRERFLMARLAGYAMVVFAAYAIPTVVMSKQEFYGTAFYFALILMFLDLWNAASARWRRYSLVMTAVPCLLGLCLAKFPPHRYDRGSPTVIARNQLVDAIYHRLRAEDVRPRSAIYLTSSGYFNRAVLNYVALIRDLFPLRIIEQPFTDDLKLHAREIDRADFVIASERGNSEAWEGFIKSGTVQDQTLELVREDPQFELVARFPTRNEKAYYLFRRARLLQGLEPIDGIGPLEGPDPALHLSEFRWGLGPRSRFWMDAGTGGAFRLLVFWHAAVPNETVSIRADDDEVVSQVFAGVCRPEKSCHLLHLSPGRHIIEFRYSAWKEKQYDKPVAVMFRALRLVAEKNTKQTTRGSHSFTGDDYSSIGDLE